MTTSGPAVEFRIRSVAASALLPALLFAIGEGAIIPIIPAIASNLGATLAVAGFIAGMTMIGELIGDIPSGWVVSRIGERRSMIWAAGLSIVSVILSLVAPNALVFGVGIFLLGLSAAIFALARHAFMTTYVPVQFRARALSTLGGTFRAGWFIGPFLGAGLIALTGTSMSVFWVMGLCAVAIIVLLLVVDDPTEKLAAGKLAAGKLARADAGEPSHPAPTAGESELAEEAQGLFATIWSFRAVLTRLGLGVAIVSALRASRTVVLPLWAVSLGLPESNTALIIGLGAALDFALFYSSGQIMDRFGRLWSALPSMIGMGVCLVILSFTHDFAQAVGWFIVLTVLLGVSNGVSSGIVMTLGADLAPKSSPAPFLGAFRFTSDLGSAAAPVLISAIVVVAGLPVAVFAIGAIGFAGAGVMLRYVPRYVPRSPAHKSLGFKPGA
ncbi:MFS transporter [Subtercola boreus]|uniref:MFS transporter n=1 Tax=Subtercola boreus TaxID=120213 RepID=A0A3E0WBH8_9MICO|nr:MFS transporter [Subtercola boreus]RFA20337.1 MFS transporter [Subtercola boreus]RFA20491.1 MFS transporter [Subtercola boreus]RFA26740.1 MFS transporter [Subtercola boreus]